MHPPARLPRSPDSETRIAQSCGSPCQPFRGHLDAFAASTVAAALVSKLLSVRHARLRHPRTQPQCPISPLPWDSGGGLSGSCWGLQSTGAYSYTIQAAAAATPHREHHRLHSTNRIQRPASQVPRSSGHSTTTSTLRVSTTITTSHNWLAPGHVFLFLGVAQPFSSISQHTSLQTLLRVIRDNA